MNYLSIPGIPPINAHDHYWNMGDCYRESYVRIKYEMALMFQPSRICEIGVYSGIAAFAFMAAAPSATYVGIDSLQHENAWGISVVQDTGNRLRAQGYKADIVIADSQSLDSLPHAPYDFIHVDGDHSRSGCRHDVLLAWNALTPDGHILIDNGHDMGVAAGTFDAMYELIYQKHLLDWRYYDDSVGNILIYKKPL